MDLRTLGWLLLWSIDHYILGLLCPQNSVPYQAYCYLLGDTAGTLVEARNLCGKFPGGDIATFHTEEQYQFLVDLKGYGVEASIGLVRQNGTWEFIDGSPPNYMPPTSFSNGAQEKCTSILAYNSKLSDLRCTTKRRPLCKFQSLFLPISLEMPHGTMETTQLVDGDNNTCLRIPTGCSAFAKMTLEMTNVTTGIVHFGIVSRSLPCRDPAVMVMWSNQQGKFTKCILITMETVRGDGYYRCHYECVATETKVIVVTASLGMTICELEN